MDFQEFYHSLDFNEDIFRTFINGRNDKYIERINTFVFEVLKAYSALFEVNSNVARTFLPIGFLPSNILSNWYLDCFDRAICTRLNPIYYGRYVDDIIFVEKVERNSLLYNMIKDIKNRKEKVIDYLFCNCKNDETAECTQDQSIFKKDNKTSEYKLNPNLLPSNKANVTVQNAKVKLFYFNHKYSRALLTCFRNSINNNKSEFRYLPDHDNIMISNDYSDIYELNNCDSINKLRGVESIEINKFRLSKYLGKLLKIGNLIDDNIELEFVKDINKIFTRQEIIDNYTTWEKVIEHLVLENKYDSLKVFYEAINKAINDINC